MAKPNMTQHTTERVPVILFPLHGCRDVQDMTHEEQEQLMRKHRLNLRKHWNHDGVKSAITILELTTMRLVAEAITAGATPHDAGRAAGASEQLVMLRAILTGTEKAEDEVA